MTTRWSWRGFEEYRNPSVEVVGAMEDGRSLLAAAEKLKPDIILLDISMPLLNGVDAAANCAHRAECQGDLCYHARGRYLHHSGFGAGASGYVLKANPKIPTDLGLNGSTQ